MTSDLNDAIRFGFLVQDVARLRRLVGDRALKSLNVTRAQWWVLTFLSRRDGMTQTALAADLGLTKVAVGGLLTRMETVDLVERRPCDTDARIRRVYLTRAGNKLVGRIRDQIEPFEREALTAITKDDLDVTFHALRQMKNTLLRMAGTVDAGEPPARYDDDDSL